jgi:hypothetical protein
MDFYSNVDTIKYMGKVSMLKIRLFWLTLLISVSSAAYSECVNINNISFEKIDSNKLLAIRNGKNIAIIRIEGGLPEKIGQFRFFSEQLCEFGAESKFHIDGKLFTVGSYGIQLFK